MGGRFRARGERLEADIQRLAEFGKVGPTAITRLAFDPADNAAHAHVETMMRAAGLETRYDAFGNLFGRRPGTDPRALPVVTGSHLDGPPDGGIYDGVIGVLAGIEACRLFAEAGLAPPAPIEVVAVRSEHLDRFGLSCLGSRAFGGKLTRADLDRLQDADGISLARALADSGFRPDELDSVCLRGRIRAWVELHVEQGKVLEDRGHVIGVVTGIAGPTRYRVRVQGMADHSGATPMDLRRDAYMGAAEMALELERLARATEACVGTIGIVRSFPGAVHTIPGTTEFYVDIRSTEAEEKRRLVAAYRAAMDRIAQARGLGLSVETFVDENPVPCTPWVVEVIHQTCRDMGADFMLMPSGGGHDTQHVAAVAPAAMMFIPSAGGIAHTPEEHTAIEDLVAGTEVLAETLARLAEGRGGGA
jgi:beta-ureidopropionase / N-carbamoyl-L-amino-acid hydrolase